MMVNWFSGWSRDLLTVPKCERDQLSLVQSIELQPILRGWEVGCVLRGV